MYTVEFGCLFSSVTEFALHANSGAVAISSSQRKRQRRQCRDAEGRERSGGEEEENLVNDFRVKKMSIQKNPGG